MDNLGALVTLGTQDTRHSLLPFPLSFICLVSCVPNVASASRLSILYCLFLYRLFVSCLVYPMLPGPLDCPFSIAFSSIVYLSRLQFTTAVTYISLYNVVFILHLSTPVMYMLMFMVKTSKMKNKQTHAVEIKRQRKGKYECTGTISVINEVHKIFLKLLCEAIRMLVVLSLSLIRFIKYF
jgi:hypothetical protein